MLRALDYVNDYGQGLRLYHVCRAKTIQNKTTTQKSTCGLALPTKMWTQPDPTQWKFICKVNWNALVREHQQKPEDEVLKKWVDDMHKDYGEHAKWPKIGCGASFVPNIDEGTVVAEVICADGKWEAFAADPLPMELDDEIKQVHSTKYLPGPRLGPADFHQIIPMCQPMTHQQYGFPTIAHYSFFELAKKEEG